MAKRWRAKATGAKLKMRQAGVFACLIYVVYS